MWRQDWSSSNDHQGDMPYPNITSRSSTSFSSLKLGTSNLPRIMLSLPAFVPVISNPNVETSKIYMGIGKSAIDDNETSRLQNKLIGPCRIISTISKIFLLIDILLKWMPWKPNDDKLEQLERLRSEDTPRRLMITHTIESYWIPSQQKTKSKLQI